MDSIIINKMNDGRIEIAKASFYIRTMPGMPEKLTGRYNIFGQPLPDISIPTKITKVYLIAGDGMYIAKNEVDYNRFLKRIGFKGTVYKDTQIHKEVKI